ncbi:CopD family protein [Gallaecimonas kandeliae]|uniref:CopD family protein n=1 Tax=Gallaecimonas kandeliae TaxID=3029055 RepID=UPI00264717AB|nr:CopD family protein [Gallaecimonas kandeliae]WKE65403.1 CopD family protein [Gallaecimonas kandeliae]
MYYYILSLHLLGAILVAGAPLLSLLSLLPLGLRKGEWQPLADAAIAFERLAWPLLALMLGSGVALTWMSAANVSQLWSPDNQAGLMLLAKSLGTLLFAGLWWGWRYRVLPRLGQWPPRKVVAYLAALALVATLLVLGGMLYLTGFFQPEGQGL